MYKQLSCRGKKMKEKEKKTLSCEDQWYNMVLIRQEKEGRRMVARNNEKAG